MPTVPNHISRIKRTALGVASILSSAAIIAGGFVFTPAVQAQVAPIGQGFTLNASDLRFILAQIKIAEEHAATPGYPCSTILSRIGSPVLPFGLRTVDGTCNNLLPGQEKFGAADLVFPRLTEPSFRPAEGGTSYLQKSGLVNDSQPRIASNLIVDHRSVAVLRMRNGTSQSPFRLALGDNPVAPAAPLRVTAPSRRVPCGDGRTVP